MHKVRDGAGRAENRRRPRRAAEIETGSDGRENKQAKSAQQEEPRVAAFALRVGFCRIDP
jgi:hypothetical protein